MEILGIEKVSMVDYQDKICATVFTGGCNFRCPFCHNSGIVENQYSVIPENEIFDYLESRKKLLDGVVVSGGEPTLQRDLPLFAERVKSMGYLVKLDTNGTNPFVLERLLKDKLIDYAAIDIKNDFEHYALVAGVANPAVENIKKSLALLKQYGVPYELRTTLIGEFHNIENIKQMAEELKGEKILYLQKFKISDGVFNKNLTEVSKDEAEEFRKILSKTIEKVELRGY